MPYATVEQLREYATARGLAVPEPDSECLVLLTVAHDWLEVQQYKGAKTEPEQENQWPRKGATLDGYYLLNDQIPRIIINAECQLAIDSMSVDLMPTGEGRELLSEEVEGAVKVTYAETGSGAVIPQPTKAKAMIRPLLQQSTGFMVSRL
ncbi:DnaT-like ssDNA-binding protein [Endozoicomonas sp. GU-1]|uniref:DnaT-like ssDNA-binding protein n=1 Tax=Endozoicomonas sp. GU-1 TaxID=3009078 RepID=UPI0022B3CCF9|nr:DnaT-like ssDNA-binding protein [Endozoicomonas sp. GU-1]WBA79558.1 hypothetical protein O2T12_14335 [Endozoicomonas sp. GU-1]